MAVEIKIPSVGESVSEVTIANWIKHDGDYVEMDEVICEIDSDKASFEINAEAAGVLRTKVEEGDTVEIGTVVAEIDTDAAAPEEDGGEGEEEKASTAGAEKANEKSSQKTEPAREEKEGTYAEGHASPAAAKILREKGISPEAVQGTGKDGRITKEDAEKASAKKSSQAQPAMEAAKKPEPQPQRPTGERSTRREKVSTLRRTIARRLVEVKNETAMLTTFNEVDMTEVMALRKQFKEKFKEKHGVGLGFMSFFTKACTAALMEFPAVNAYLEENEMVYHDYCDVGIAVSTERGLVVPVLRSAEQMSLADIEKALGEIAGRARENKITIDEMQGGTFTITNGGVFGSMLSTPIINPPQSAILGMHNIVERPMVVNGEIKVRPIMYLALSYDHRIIDGKEAVSFLFRVKEFIENPGRLLLGV